MIDASVVYPEFRLIKDSIVIYLAYSVIANVKSRSVSFIRLMKRTPSQFKCEMHGIWRKITATIIVSLRVNFILEWPKCDRVKNNFSFLPHKSFYQICKNIDTRVRNLHWRCYILQPMTIVEKAKSATQFLKINQSVISLPGIRFPGSFNI